MLSPKIITKWILPAVVLMPKLAFAVTLNRVLGYLDIFVGLFLTASIIMFFGALLTYFTRYGTPRRAEVFPFMEWAIAIVFFLIILLALINFFQNHTTAALYVLGGVMFLLFVKLIISAAQAKAAAEKKKESAPPGGVPVVRP